VIPCARHVAREMRRRLLLANGEPPLTLLPQDT